MGNALPVNLTIYLPVIWGMTIHLPIILMWTTGGKDPSKILRITKVPKWVGNTSATAVCRRGVWDSTPNFFPTAAWPIPTALELEGASLMWNLDISWSSNVDLLVFTRNEWHNEWQNSVILYSSSRRNRYKSALSSLLLWFPPLCGAKDAWRRRSGCKRSNALFFGLRSENFKRTTGPQTEEAKLYVVYMQCILYIKNM